MGTPGPSPGGPGLTPYSTGAAPPAATSAQPPMHRPSRARSAKKVPPGPGSTTDTAAQLNQAELARLQAGAPPEPPPAAMSSGRAPGPKTSGGNYIPSSPGPGKTTSGGTGSR